jgi:hypothetical protein
VSYNFSDSLYPTQVPSTSAGVSNSTAGELLGPVAVSASPGTYALGLTIPIINMNSSSQPSVLGYLVMVVSAGGLLRAVNDSTGMGQTGQTLVVARNNSQYQIVLPPLRTPQVFGQMFNLSQNPAVQAIFQNQTGYNIDTHNALGDAVSEGYTVFSLVSN